MMLIVWVVILPVLSQSTPSHVCSDTTSYTSYNHTTRFKGLLNEIPWDLTRNTDKLCNMTHYPATSQPKSCGDCDFNLQEEVWYRFDKGPYSKIAEIPDIGHCPKQGHCNGFGQVALVKNEAKSNSTVFVYSMVFSSSDPPPGISCSVYRSLVQGYNCTDFILYKFAKGWNGFNNKCTTTKSTEYYTPYSLCMEDAVIQTTLTPNRLFYPGSGSSTGSWWVGRLSCSSTSYPTPPRIGWTETVGASTGPADDPSFTDDPPFTVTSTLTDHHYSPMKTCSSLLNTSLLHRFHRVDITPTNFSVEAGREVECSCQVRIGIYNYYQDPPIEWYLIRKTNEGAVYYTPDNYTDMHVESPYWDELYTGYTVIFTFRGPPTVLGFTQEWECGVRDPVSEQYITQHFTITTTPDKMRVFYCVMAGLAVYLLVTGVMAHVAIMVLMIIRRRRRNLPGVHWPSPTRARSYLRWRFRGSDNARQRCHDNARQDEEEAKAVSKVAGAIVV